MSSLRSRILRVASKLKKVAYLPNLEEKGDDTPTARGKRLKGDFRKQLVEAVGALKNKDSDKLFSLLDALNSTYQRMLSLVGSEALEQEKDYMLRLLDHGMKMALRLDMEEEAHTIESIMDRINSR